jgi:asparaginyl-tRNA synthetase
MSVCRDGFASVDREVLKFAVENIKTASFALEPRAARERKVLAKSATLELRAGAETVEKISVAAARQASAIGRQVCLQGWVRTRRDSKGGFSFLELNDGSCLGNLQVVADAQLENYETEILRLSAGCSVSVYGQVKESGGKGQVTEVAARQIVVHGWADPESYPLQKKRHSFEKLREWAHLRPRTNTFGAVMRVRNCVSQSIHRFFQEHGFLYIHTPIITASDCEGAGEMFRVTTIDPANPPRSEGKIDYSRDFFARPTFLTVSGQLEAEIFATSLGKVYTFGPTFRAENSNTSRHLAEFWMIEPEMAFYELADNMQLAEAFLKRILNDTLEQCREDMEFFNQFIDDTLLATLQGIADSPFLRLPYSEAIEILSGSGEPFEYPVTWGCDLQSEHERFLTEKHFGQPVILYDYPRSLKPFYMKVNDDGRTVRAMDVLVPKVGELIGGSQREDQLEMLQTRMQEQGLNPDDYWWYLDLRRFGTVPHSGFGLGLERVIQFVTGMANIRDAIPFPRTPGSAEF